MERFDVFASDGDKEEMRAFKGAFSADATTASSERHNEIVPTTNASPFDNTVGYTGINATKSTTRADENVDASTAGTHTERSTRSAVLSPTTTRGSRHAGGKSSARYLDERLMNQVSKAWIEFFRWG